MIDLLPLEQARHLNKPRRVTKYVLIWCSSGRATLLVDEQKLTLRAGELVTITSGQIHSLQQARSAKGWVLEFTLDFFCKDDKDIELIFHNGMFCHFDLNEVVGVARPAVVAEQLRLIADELRRKPYQYLLSIHSRIELILVEINRTKVERGDEIYKPNALFLRFLETVRADFEHAAPLSQIARALGTTAGALNALSKLHAGKTAQKVLQGLRLSEAKRLLTYQNLSVKEAAFKLGFNDPFYFSNFFKKHTRQSPLAYQKDHAL